ncbi:POK11 protein, partial [Ptilonorhynchus violaceus]|nr:POK11 protein [Ptilonorhynchus violaceus]
GFEIQTEKIQRTCPWTYLGLHIRERMVIPQQLTIRDDTKTLRDLHQICGSINCIRPWLGITTEDLTPLFKLLEGGEGLDSPCALTAEAQEALDKVQNALSYRQAHRYHPELPFHFAILGSLPHIYGLVFQWDAVQKDPLSIIEWVFLPHKLSKTITRPQELMAWLIARARFRLRTLTGCDFACIYLPLRIGDLRNLLETNENLQYALDRYPGKILVHYPKHQLFNSALRLIPKEIQSRKPLKALTIYTNGSGRSHKDLQTSEWVEDVKVVEGSLQIVELAAIVRAFERFPEPFNLVTDSACVAGIVARVEHSWLREVPNPKLAWLLSRLVTLISHREQPFHVMHTRSHTGLPGPIAEGDRRADTLAMLVTTPGIPGIFQQAKLSHQMFHQNVPSLIWQFHLPCDQAKAIVATCPQCQHYQMPSLSQGVNPRGLNSCQRWQTDVTHIASFGRQKFVRVSTDTFLGAVFASAHMGE